MLAFEGRGKLEHPNKNLSEQEGENQQQIQPTYMYDTTSRTCTWAILVGRELSHTPPHYLSSLFLIIILQATRGACSLFLVSDTLFTVHPDFFSIRWHSCVVPTNMHGMTSKALVLSSRFIWCHRSHVNIHARDATIIITFNSQAHVIQVHKYYLY